MRVCLRKIPDGKAGTLATLVEIFRVIESGQVDPVIVRFTRNAIGSTSFKRERTLIRKITKAWLRRVRILEDPVRHEFVQSPARSLAEGRGDCDDLVAAVGASLEHVGFAVELIVASQSPKAEEDFSHVWLRAWLPRAGIWLPVDPRGMAQFGWPIGRELPVSSLTAIGSYGFDEESSQLVDGSSLMLRTRTSGLGRTHEVRLRPATSRPPLARRLRPVTRSTGRSRLRGMGQSFPFVEATSIEGQGEATAGPGGEDAASLLKDALKPSRVITGLTVAFLLTGIVRNLRR